jgi:uncharacterized membrane-anchored protein
MGQPSDEADRLGLRSHPLRAALSAEMHVRKLPYVTAPARLLQIVTLFGEHGIATAHAHVASLCARHGVTVPPGVKHVVGMLGAYGFVWERHTEFASYTFIASGPGEAAFGTEPFAEINAEWLGDLPGEVIRATIIALIAGDPSAEWLDRFAPDDLIVCDVAEGRARIWSDFRLHADGFGRLLIGDRGLVGYEGAQLVQRLQELGNYRNMALLALPLAQALTPQVTALEQRLEALTAAIAAGASSDDSLLDELSFLSAELARLMTDTSYRMSATRAYAQLSTDRLHVLASTPVRGHPTLVDFTERRLLPAVRTCQSFSQRLEDLAQRAQRTSSLLRTRVDTALARQNRDLLDSMNHRTAVQVRLQQAVEGLSVVAISYYVVGLLGYVVKGLHEELPWLKPEVAVALAVPAVVLFAALVMRRIRRGAHHG